MKSFAETLALGCGYNAKDEKDAIAWLDINYHPEPDPDGSMCDTCSKECKSTSFQILACKDYHSSR